jgi:hypothetical protein
MATPTFATGLGVVVAAAIAYQMGAPSFRVAAPRWDGHRCATSGCEASSAPAGPASVQGSRRMPSPTPAATARAHAANPAASPGPAGSPGGGAYGGVRPGGPAVSYRTESSWPGGFEGSVAIGFAPGHMPRHWWLRFSYPAGLIQRVWGPVTWHRLGEHMAVLEYAADGPGTDGAEADGSGADGRGVQVWFQVAGTPGPPQQCHLNGVTCRVG